jgi:hypothetical protein
MLCRVDHVEHGHVAVHATYLATDGSQKAAIEPVRKTFGPIAGSAIRFGMPQPDQWLCVGEGIESTLSLCVSTDCPGWAALSAGGIIGLRLPPAARRVLIGADHDDAGIEAADIAKRRWEGAMRASLPAATPIGNDRLLHAIEMVKRWWPDLAEMDFVSPARRRARTGVKIPEG